MNFAKWYMEMEQVASTFPNPKKYYLACVLNPISQENLKSFAEKKYLEQMSQAIPSNWAFKCHHYTVKFNCTLQDFQNYQNLFKQEVMIQVVQLAWDDNCIAAKVVTHPSVASDNQVGHITIAHSNNVKAEYSNTLLASNDNYKPQTRYDVPLSSMFLAVLKYNQSQTWPEVSPELLASPSLIS